MTFFSHSMLVYSGEYVSIHKLPQTLFSCFFILIHSFCDIFIWIMPHGLSLITVNVEEAGISEINRTNKCFSKCLACQGEGILQSSFSCSFFLARSALSLVCWLVFVHFTSVDVKSLFPFSMQLSRDQLRKKSAGYKHSHS